MPKLSPVSYKQLVRVFEAEGFSCVRTEGDHMVFTKPGIIRPVVIAKHASIRFLMVKNNLQTVGISRRPLLLTPWQVALEITTFAIKQDTFYVAYAPDFDMSAYGGCQDEALNNLTDEIRECHAAESKTISTQPR
jgi:predicted RNA binding protein YcfA (HicA-like mRNA interferase family)